MNLTFAGVMLNSASPELYERTDLYSRGWEQFWNKASAGFTSRNVNVRRDYGASGMGRVNYPPMHMPELNVLYWPSGAARFAHFVALVNQQQLDTITGALDNSGSAQLVIEDDQSKVKIQARMCALAPWPVWQNNNQWFLLPLVDQRYSWQHLSTGILTGDYNSSSHTWTDLLTALQTASGLTLHNDSPASAYKIPDPDEIVGRQYENFAIMLDAVAWSVGMRVTVGFDGTVYLDNATTAQSDFTDNLGKFSLSATNQQDVGKLILSGGTVQGAKFAAMNPAKVSVIFRAYVYGHAVTSPAGPLPSIYKRSKNAPGSLTTISGTEKIIRSTAYADFSTRSGTPDNATEVNALGDLIADDFYAFSAKNYDLTAMGLVQLTPCAFDDAIEYRWASRRNGKLESFTRWVSASYNISMDELWHQFEDCPSYSAQGNIALIGTDSTATPNAKHTDKTTSGFTNTTVNMVVKRKLDSFPTWADAKKAIAYWNEANSQWEEVQEDC